MSTCKLMEPIQVGSYTFKNRIVMAPMETRLCTPIGDTTPQMCDYYAERAKGGAAAIIVENTFVDSYSGKWQCCSWTGMCWPFCCCQQVCRKNAKSFGS